jgi:hypothetical protein
MELDEDPRPAARDRAHNEMVELLQNIGFSEGAAMALADNQLLNRHQVLDQMDNTNVTDVCKAVRKPGGGEDDGRSTVAAPCLLPQAPEAYPDEI